MSLKQITEGLKRISGVFIDAYFVADREGNITDFNPTFYGFFPKSIARQLRRKRYDEVVKLESPGRGDIVTECLTRGQAIRYDEIKGVIPDVRDLILIVSAVPLSEEGDDSPMGVLVLLRDVTDEAQMQNKYKQMLEIEAEEKAKLETTIRDKTETLLETNELLNDAQKELMQFRKGLRVF